MKAAGLQLFFDDYGTNYSDASRAAGGEGVGRHMKSERNFTTRVHFLGLVFFKPAHICLIVQRCRIFILYTADSERQKLKFLGVSLKIPITPLHHPSQLSIEAILNLLSLFLQLSVVFFEGGICFGWHNEYVAIQRPRKFLAHKFGDLVKFWPLSKRRWK